MLPKLLICKSSHGGQHSVTAADVLYIYLLACQGMLWVAVQAWVVHVLHFGVLIQKTGDDVRILRETRVFLTCLLRASVPHPTCVWRSKRTDKVRSPRAVNQQSNGEGTPPPICHQYMRSRRGEWTATRYSLNSAQVFTVREGGRQGNRTTCTWTRSSRGGVAQPVTVRRWAA